MLNLSAKIIIFTDLDGTLLDHETYSYEAATEALDKLRQREIPLILASSKTAAEIAPLQKAIGFQHCEAIVENGAGTLEPYSAQTHSDEIYQNIISTINSLGADLRAQFQGFSDWSAAEISEQTGLSVKAAEKAKLRQFSEPGLWYGDEKEFAAFRAALLENNLSVQQGGRFLSISYGGSKALQMGKVLTHYQNQKQRVFSIALGDAPNDIEMIEAADRGIIILNREHDGIPDLQGEKIGTISRSSKPGPEGWNESILELLKSESR